MATRIQLRRGTAAAWTAANPVLADGEIGVETDTRFYKIGNGVTAWTALAYGGLQSANTISVASMASQAIPATPASGVLSFFARLLSGRMMLFQKGPSGLTTSLQPSFATNQITMITPSVTTTVNVVGMSVTSVGTISHPAPSEAYGYMANFAGAGTAAATSGTGNSASPWYRGSVAGGANGFFFFNRLAFIDTTYDSVGASTGSRIFSGLTNGTLAAQVGADDPTGHWCGFFRRHVNGGATDTNWKFGCKDSTASDFVDTGMVFTAQHVYDFYIFCAPLGGTVYWRIDDLTAGTTAEGSTSTRLPSAAVAMRGGFQVSTVEAVVRNVMTQKLYIEAPR
jgi:hypothetical protein